MVALPLPAATSSRISRSRSVRAGKDAALDLRSENRLARGGRANGPFDFLLLGPLEQVAPCAGSHGREDRVVVLEHREDDNRGG
jgi:hypothetical protein